MSLKPVYYYFFCGKQKRYFDKCLSGFVFIQWRSVLFAYKHASKYLALCLAEERKVCNDMRVVNDEKMHFRVTYAFKKA